MNSAGCVGADHLHQKLVDVGVEGNVELRMGKIVKSSAFVGNWDECH